MEVEDYGSFSRICPLKINNHFTNGNILKRILTGNTAPARQHVFLLFNEEFYKSDLLLADERHIFFHNLQHEMATQTDTNYVRTELLKAFSAILQIFEEDLPGEVKDDILEGVVNICRAVGMLSQHSDKQYTHLCMDVTRFAVLLTTSSYYRDTNCESKRLMFEKITGKMLLDLLKIASCSKRGEIWQEMFDCSCFDDLCLLLIQIYDQTQSTQGLTFWHFFTKVINEQMKKQPIKANNRNMNTEFKLRMSCKLTALYKEKILNSPNSKQKVLVPANWHCLEEDFTTLLQNNNINEESLKFVIQAYIRLSNGWLPNVSVFKTIWDCVNKRMIASSSTATTGSLTSYFKQQPNTTIDDVLGSLRATKPKSQMTAFDWFCTALEKTVDRLKQLSYENLASQVKTNILSKFHKKRMESMSPLEYERFMFLYVKCTVAFNAVEFTHKLVVNTSFVNFDEKSSAFKKNIIAAHFIAILLCKELSFANTELLVRKAAEIFKNLVSKLNPKMFKSETYLAYLILIDFYLEGVLNFYDHENSSPGDEFLLPNVFKRLFAVLSKSPQSKSRVLRRISALFKTKFVQTSNNRSGLLKFLWSNVYANIGETEYEDRAQLAADFTILMVKDPDSGPVTLNEILTQHLHASQSLEVKEHYLSLILSDTSVAEALSQNEHAKTRQQIINVWLHHNLLAGRQNNSTTTSLSDQLLTFCEFRQYGVTAQHSDIELCVAFVRSVGERYSKLQYTTEMSHFRIVLLSYLGDIADVCRPHVTACTCSETVDAMFRICSSIVAYCSRALYSKTLRGCLLPQLLDDFVLPLVSLKKSTLFLTKVEENLHLFLQGLSALDFKRDEFILRKTKEVYQRYFVQYSAKNFTSTTSQNPFVVAIMHLKDTKQFSEYINFVSTFVLPTFLNLPQLPYQVTAVLNFFLSLTKVLDVQHTRIFAADCLEKAMHCLLICLKVEGKGEPPKVRRLALDLSKVLMASCSEVETYDSKMVSKIKNFAEKEYLKNKTELLTMMLLLGRECADMVRKVHPYLQTLAASESKDNLREILQKLEVAIGIR